MNAVTWPSGTTSQALFTSQFTIGTYISVEVIGLEVGSISSNIYLWGDMTAVGGSPTYAFIRKIGTDDSQIWNSIPLTKMSWEGLSSDYTETYLYLFVSSSAGILTRFKAADGSLDFAKSSLTINPSISSSSYMISLSPNSQTLFFSAAFNTGGYLWRWKDGNSYFEWAGYNGNSQANSLVSADSNVAYLLNTETTSN